jgi:NSS family neurotransmitter:Na+ symporter
MLTYSSYLPRKSDLVNNAFITGFLNSGFSLVSGILIFSILGNMALSEGVPVPEVVSSGIGLAFITIPRALSLYLPWPSVLGPAFFACLFLAGFLSVLSLLEPILSAVIEKTHWSRQKVTHLVMPLLMLASLLFASNAGMLILDIFDHFLNNVALLISALLELLLMCWFFKTDWVRDYVNPFSELHVGHTWAWSLKYVTIFLLLTMLLNNIAVDLGFGLDSILQGLKSTYGLDQLTIQDLQHTYGNYSPKSVFLIGWMPILIIWFAAFGLQRMRRDNVFSQYDNPTDTEES